MVQAQENVRYSRRQPEIWTDLVNFSYESLYENEKPWRTGNNSLKLLDKLEQLNNQALDEVRYYGLGLIMCGIARSLRDPKNLDSAITRTGENLYSHWRSNPSAEENNAIGVQSSDFNHLESSSIFDDLAPNASDELPPAIQYLNDGLERA
jgi:hypothetical protein